MRSRNLLDSSRGGRGRLKPTISLDFARGESRFHSLGDLGLPPYKFRKPFVVTAPRPRTLRARVVGTQNPSKDLPLRIWALYQQECERCHPHLRTWPQQSP